MMKKYCSLFFLITLFFLSCDDNSETVSDNGFDRTTLLTNTADNLIIPSFQDLQTKVNALETASNTFTAMPDQTNLDAFQTAWREAMLSFVRCSPFAFGPADLPLGTFVEVLGTFPVDETQVEANINNSTFNLASSFDRDVRGFLTIEYLIFDLNGDADVLAKYGAGSENRIDYLKTIMTEIKTVIDDINTEWQGDYRAEFVGNDDTSAGSPISLLYNAWIKDYENIKNFKIELPAGLQAGQSSVLPQNVEAYYSGISTELIEEHFTTTENVWLGTGVDGTDGVGFEEYLLSVEGGEDLVNQTKPKIQEIKDAINALPSGRLSNIIESNEVKALHTVLQDNTANFKSSMSSLLGISITFASGDGD